MWNYILKPVKKWMLFGFIVVSIFCLSSHILAEENKIDYTIQYKTNKNDDYGVISTISNGVIEINYMGNQYSKHIYILGNYKGRMTDKEYSDIISLVTDKEFLNSKSDETIAPGDPYTLITLMQDTHIIASKAYRGGAYDEHSRALQVYLYNIMMKYTTTLKPETGLSLTCGNIYKKDEKYIFLDFTLRNERTHSTTILTSGSYPIISYLAISTEESKLDSAKYFTQDNIFNIPTDPIEIHPGEQIILTYRLSSAELPSMIGCIGSSHIVSLENTKTNEVYSFHFSSTSNIEPKYVVEAKK